MKLTQQLVKELLIYNEDTGKLFWRARREDLFKNGIYEQSRRAKRWNTRYANKEAFTNANQAGYLTGLIFRKLYLAHRIIWFYMTGEWPQEVDHINGNTSDNRWCNLRNVDSQINTKNKGRHSNNTSGFKGVCWHKRDQKWTARLTIDGERKQLGYFDTAEEAFMEYAQRAKVAGYTNRHIYGTDNA